MNDSPLLLWLSLNYKCLEMLSFQEKKEEKNPSGTKSRAKIPSSFRMQEVMVRKKMGGPVGKSKNHHNNLKN